MTVVGSIVFGFCATTLYPKTRAAEARRFAEWLVSPDTQRAIGAFGVARFGQPLFVPDAKKE